MWVALGKSRIPAEAADPDDALPALRHAEVGRVHLAQVDAIPRLDQRTKQVQNVSSVLAGEEALDVLKHEGERPLPHDYSSEQRHERYPGIPCLRIPTEENP